MKVKLDPNFTCDDSMTQEELDDLIETLSNMTMEELEKGSIPIDMQELKEEDPELYEALTKERITH